MDRCSPRITKINKFFSFPHRSVGGKGIFVSTNMPGSTRVYHPVPHTGNHIHLRHNGRYHIISFNQICTWLRRITSSWPMSTLFSVMTHFSTNKTISFLLEGWDGGFGNIVNRVMFLICICVPLLVGFVLNHVSTSGECFCSCSRDLLPTSILNYDVGDEIRKRKLLGLVLQLLLVLFSNVFIIG